MDIEWASARVPPTPLKKEVGSGRGRLNSTKREQTYQVLRQQGMTDG